VSYIVSEQRTIIIVERGGYGTVSGANMVGAASITKEEKRSSLPIAMTEAGWRKFVDTVNTMKTLR